MNTDLVNVIELYFSGLYTGNVEQLKTVFHPQAILAGEVRGNPYYKPVMEYLEIVRLRQSPQALGESFQMKILTVEIQGQIAFAKVSCPMLGYNYLDFLSFVRKGGEWVLVSKVFTDL